MAAVHAGSCCRAGLAASHSYGCTPRLWSRQAGAHAAIFLHRGVAWQWGEVLPAGAAVLTWWLPRCHGHTLARLACRFGKFLGITVLESFAASAMGLSVGSIAPTGLLHALWLADT